MGAVALPIMIGLTAIGVGTTIYGGIETRNANRRMEARNQEQEAEYQRQAEEQRRLAEEQARIEKQQLLKKVGFQREELGIKEEVLKASQELEQKQIAEKISNLRQTYEDVFAEYNAAQTVRGLTQTFAPKQTRLTHDYLKDNEGLALLKSFMQKQAEQETKAINIAKEELDTVEKFGKETNELNLKGITNKAEAELQMSQFRIKNMREEVADLNRASIFNDIGSLFKMGREFISPYVESSMYKGFAPKFNYEGNAYGELMKNLTFGSSGKFGNAFKHFGLSSVFG
ncbi:hypothetical protein GAMM_200014 [Gammaproteobacteria bacterium]